MGSLPILVWDNAIKEERFDSVIKIIYDTEETGTWGPVGCEIIGQTSIVYETSNKNVCFAFYIGCETNVIWHHKITTSSRTHFSIRDRLAFYGSGSRTTSNLLYAEHGVYGINNMFRNLSGRFITWNHY